MGRFGRKTHPLPKIGKKRLSGRELSQVSIDLDTRVLKHFGVQARQSKITLRPASTLAFESVKITGVIR